MEKILFINACVRPESRTSELADAVLQKVNGEIEQVDLYEAKLQIVGLKELEKRDKALEDMAFEDEVFNFAKQFANADRIVIAAPYWDLMFPSVLKVYLENVTVSGITFGYTADGKAQGKCKAKALYYVTTSGGFIGENDFGFAYVNALAKNFFGINEIHRFSAEGLDISGADVEKIVENAKNMILEELK